MWPKFLQRWTVALFLCGTISVGSCLTSSASWDEIKNLPGLGRSPSFKQYSGYLKTNGDRFLHYWFVESQRRPRSDPMVLWLNGGPGCSSLTGLLDENGPFKVDAESNTLKPNPHSWNKIANVLYLESPAGVGFSYATSKNYTTNDDQTCEDNFAALKNFFATYPQFKRNEFYITGESYAGIYVPMLAEKVLDDSSFNFKGFAVGNGLLDNDMVMNGLVHFVYYHGLIGTRQWRATIKRCCGGINPEIQRCDFSAAARKNRRCDVLVTDAYNMAWNIGINPYNVFGKCEGGVPRKTSDTWRVGNRTVFSVLTPFLFRTDEEEKLIEKLKKQPEDEVDSGLPCTATAGTTNYLNQADVRRALHIPRFVQDWNTCSGVVSLYYTQLYSTMRPQFEKVLAQGKRISIYNGDADMACNFIGDEWFVDSLGQAVTEPYKPWYYFDESNLKQVAGFVKQFKDITFLTVRGSGHLVPEDKPLPAFILFKKFLENEPF